MPPVVCRAVACLLGLPSDEHLRLAQDTTTVVALNADGSNAVIDAATSDVDPSSLPVAVTRCLRTAAAFANGNALVVTVVCAPGCVDGGDVSPGDVQGAAAEAEGLGLPFATATSVAELRQIVAMFTMRPSCRCDASWLGARDDILSEAQAATAEAWGVDTDAVAVSVSIDLSVGCDQLVKRLAARTHGDGGREMRWIAKVPREAPADAALDKVAAEGFANDRAVAAGLRVPRTVLYQSGRQRRFLLQECVEGTLLFSLEQQLAALQGAPGAPDSPHVAGLRSTVRTSYAELGAALAQLHKAHPAPPGEAAFRNPAAATVSQSTAYGQDALEYHLSCNGVPKGTSLEAAAPALATAHMESLVRTGFTEAEAGRISAAWLQHAAPRLAAVARTVFVHGDAHATNTIIGAEGAVLIDWGDCAFDAAAADFAPMYPDLHARPELWAAMLGAYCDAANSHESDESSLIDAAALDAEAKLFSFQRLLWACSPTEPHRTALSALATHFTTAPCSTSD